MSEKCNRLISIKKKLMYNLESYLNFGFIEGQQSFHPECVICGEKLAPKEKRLETTDLGNIVADVI